MKSCKLIALLLFVTILLAACGANKIADGAKEMKQTLRDMKSQLEANDEAKVQKGAEELEESWEKFEDSVKDKSPDLYEKVETPLHMIEAGAKLSPLDKDTLNKAIDDLDAQLSEVENLK